MNQLQPHTYTLAKKTISMHHILKQAEEEALVGPFHWLCYGKKDTSFCGISHDYNAVFLAFLVLRSRVTGTGWCPVDVGREIALTRSERPAI